ncbi:hypothetical protein [Spirosoma sp. KUDC1026]|uniref:hypothetical protein n=1 Tax=Spirosoma sp. KUDC1026 TaxID=2745947 RepID=UPI00159BBC7E|nr:hypothetical protein [Spirosoma sp. KUDC1026]QKZ14070.1 hypothetical protein HU175_16110 [Spirosoma sp. KUDC1026]
MPDSPIHLLPKDEQPSIQTCRSQHCTWNKLLIHNEQEIDQLQELLADLLEKHTYRSLRHRALDYYSNLNQLKSRIQRLRLDMICEGVDCSPVEPTPCREPRFGLFATIESHFRSLTDEFSHLKAGCYQFLSVVVTLNLL